MIQLHDFRDRYKPPARGLGHTRSLYLFIDATFHTRNPGDRDQQPATGNSGQRLFLLMGNSSKIEEAVECLSLEVWLAQRKEWQSQGTSMESTAIVSF